MTRTRQLLLALLPVTCAVLVLAVSALGQNDPPAKKPPSTDEQVRQLMQFAAASTAKHDAQLVKNEQLEKELAALKKQIAEEAEARKKATDDTESKLNKSVDRVREVSPPVGTVVMWWGGRDKIPAGWEICDGKPVHTPDAILTGVKPNFEDRYPKGALAVRETVADLAKAAGGSNNMPALKIGVISGLKVEEDGEGKYRIPVVEAGTLLQNGKPKAPSLFNGTFSSDTVPGGGKHGHKLTGYVGSEKGVSADGNDTTGAKQPAFQEIFFIVRVK